VGGPTKSQARKRMLMGPTLIVNGGAAGGGDFWRGSKRTITSKSGVNKAVILIQFVESCQLLS